MTTPGAPMMTDDRARVEELLERLRAEVFTGRHALGGGTTGHTDDDGIVHPGKSWGGDRIMALRNPDGPAAAALIEQLLTARTPEPSAWVALVELEARSTLLLAAIDKHNEKTGDDLAGGVLFRFAAAVGEARKILDGTTPPAAVLAERVEKLVEAARSIVDNATRSYRARNGQQCYIEDESGEAMMLVPHEDWHALEAAVDAIRARTISEEG